jgi:hypothetical protein
MRWLITFFRSWFSSRRDSASRRHLIGMYFDESNSGGRRKANRERS